MTGARIIAARRTPIAPRGGTLATLEPHDLARPLVGALLQEAGLAPAEVGELILSNALGAGGNPARLAALAAGLPERVGGLTIDRQCAGGLDSVLLAAALIEAGHHEVIIAGGAESYSRRPRRARIPPEGGAPVPYDQAPFTPWPGRDPEMAEAADALARELGIAQAEQDGWAIESHRKALAISGARQAAELVAVGGLEADAFTRALTPRHCARAPKVAGSITAANMAVAADGAAFLLVVSESMARRIGCSGLALLGHASLGADPERPGLAPIPAIGAALAKARLAASDIASAEIMEAFAVQAIACQRGAGLPEDIVNHNGGALARGHPVGASGAVLAVSLFHQLRETGGRGLAAIAAAGGLGTALVAEMR